MVGTVDEADTEQVVAAPRHRVAPAGTWPWLPTVGKGILARHPWCENCGEVQVVGADRAISRGGIANLLGRLDRRLRQNGLKFTEAQKRLVMLRLASAGADDTFGLSHEAQFRIIQCAVSEIVGLSPTTTAAYLRSC